MNGFLTGCLLQVDQSVFFALRPIVSVMNKEWVSATLMVNDFEKAFFVFFYCVLFYPWSLWTLLFRFCKRTSPTSRIFQSSSTIKCWQREEGRILRAEEPRIRCANKKKSIWICQYWKPLRSRAHRGIECRAEFSHVGNIWNAPLLTHWVVDYSLVPPIELTNILSEVRKILTHWVVDQSLVWVAIFQVID